jgi:hypothetical protein
MQTQNATDKHIVSYLNVNLKKTRMKQHQKTRFFSVRMTNAEYDHLQLACYKDGLTKGEFIRRHLTELLKHGTYANTPTKSTNQDS